MHRVAVIQARMGSTRLPGKVLADLGGRAVLERITAAANTIPGVDAVIVATSDTTTDDAVAAWCQAHGVPVYRGSADDVLTRVLKAAESANASIVLRITGDCPLLDPQVCGQVLALLIDSGADYASNVDPPTWPDGLDCEALTIDTLRRAAAASTRADDREHVTPLIRRDREAFKVVNLGSPNSELRAHRWTLDTPTDLAWLRQLYAHLHADNPNYLDVLEVLRRKPTLTRNNTEDTLLRNESYTTQRNAAAMENTRFTRSQQALNRALRTIPLGAQTFSKCYQQLPRPVSPLFLTHSDGGRVWDVDGNEYIDLGCGLLSVLLGHRDPDVDAAIHQQLNRGISFTLPTMLEAELAERLVQMIPCAERMRFAKNGTDATSGCIRVARAYTGRDRVAVAGYHGWQDWYIGATTRNKGVPGATSALTHTFPFGDIEALERLLHTHQGEFAAVILEPMNVSEPPNGYLDELAALVRREGALLIFDEIITGFRFAKGGAQELFGVTPDLAAFGKGLGNGMPISAVVGRKLYMEQMEEVFFSGTFGGEALSLAAAIAVTDKVTREPVVEQLRLRGDGLRHRTQQLIDAAGLSRMITLAGHPSWILMQFHDGPEVRKEALRTAWMQHMLTHGVLTLGSHNLCYAHTQDDMDRVLFAWEATLRALSNSVSNNTLLDDLNCPVIEPVFKVR